MYHSLSPQIGLIESTTSKETHEKFDLLPEDWKKKKKKKRLSDPSMQGDGQEFDQTDKYWSISGIGWTYFLHLIIKSVLVFRSSGCFGANINGYVGQKNC